MTLQDVDTNEVVIPLSLLVRIQRHLVGPEPTPTSPDMDDYFKVVAEVDELLAGTT